MAAAGKIVAVTGASGYVAGEVIKQLLEKGYTVRGTVRSLEDKEKTKHLTETFKGLKLYEADLLKPGSFDECFKGVYCVMHTASPFLRSFQDAQKELIDPALNGTKNVLASIDKNLDTIKVVVVTSSVAAVTAQNPVPFGDKVWNEDDWNTTSTLTEGPYRLSKYLAEKAAWDWHKDKPGVRMATVLPSFVLGPPHSIRTDSTSVISVIEMLNGTMKKNGCVNTCFGAVDVRNVGQAHVACLENEKATGRYLLSSESGIPHLQLAGMLKEKYGAYPLPDRQNGEIALWLKMSNERARTILGINFIPIHQSMNEMAQYLIDQGLVPPPPK
jgi:nucleoside-diphosphate-sugar epimerase